ncbi:MAG: baseplate hub protein [Stellaceae bacterium]
MKPHSPELLALLATRQFFEADLYTFTLSPGGEVLRHCGGDQDLTANGYLYPAGGQVGPYFDRKDNKAKVTSGVGVQAAQLVVDVLPGSSTVLNAPFLQAVEEGIFDAAEVTLEKAFMPTYGDTRRGTIVYFVGRVATIDAGRSVATFSINSHLELLNLNLPRNLYQAGCINSLGDPVCAVNLASFKTTGTVISGSTVDTVNASLTGSFAAGTFDLGKVVFTSGANDGETVKVNTCTFGTPNVIALGTELSVAPSPGDTFTIYYGCNKSLTDPNGCQKFSNTARFRGFLFIPQPVTAA